MLTGFSHVANAGQIVLKLVTGSALTIYYFVFLLTLSILLTAALARLGSRAIEIALVAVWLYLPAALCWPALRIAPHLFWGMRNPLYYSGYFLAGWVARERWPAVRRLGARPWAAGAACLAGVGAYAAFCWLGAPGPRASSFLFRGIYTFATIGLVTLGAASWTPPAPVRFLSSATYGIYLYHLPFILALRPSVEAWWPPYRALALFGAGVLGGALVCRVGARLLGRRARLVLGV